MKLLLDTHIWLWNHLEPAKLSQPVARRLANPGNELWLSPISLWELVLLESKGRIVLNDEVGDWVAKALRAQPLIEAPVTHEVALETRRAGIQHQDPADRFLVATAKVFGLTLVTADERLIEAGGIKVLANR